MKLFIIAAMIATTAIVVPYAQANSITMDVALSGGNANFSVVHTDNASFTDTINFTGISGDILASGSVMTIALAPLGVIIPETNIDFTSVTLNGTALIQTLPGIFEFAFTPGALALTAPPLSLIVMGNSGAGNGIVASYTGSLHVTSVPEPTSLMLLGVGLAGIGIWRRQSVNV